MRKAAARDRLKRGAVSASIAALLLVALASCETTDRSKSSRHSLPGEDEVSTLGWGRPHPGDAQPGLGNFPQSR